MIHLTFQFYSKVGLGDIEKSLYHDYFPGARSSKAGERYPWVKIKLAVLVFVLLDVCMSISTLNKLKLIWLCSRFAERRFIITQQMSGNLHESFRLRSIKLQ